MRGWTKLALPALAMALAGGTARAHWSSELQGSFSLNLGVAQERMGVLFASLAIAPPFASIDRFSIALRPYGVTDREILLTASNRTVVGQPTEADIETATARTWVASGMLPAGRYEIVRAIRCQPTRLFRGRPAVPCVESSGRPVIVEVKAGATVYLGRWSLPAIDDHAVQSHFTWTQSPPLHVRLRDAYDEDFAIFRRQRDAHAIPHAAGAVENPIAAVVARGAGRDPDGPAYLRESGEFESRSMGQLFHLAAVDGKDVHSSRQGTVSANRGNGPVLAGLKFVQHTLEPGKPVRLKLVGTQVTGAPIHALALMATGKLESVEREVEFTPAAGRDYRVAGRLRGGESDVWIEDAETRERVPLQVLEVPKIPAAQPATPD